MRRLNHIIAIVAALWTLFGAAQLAAQGLVADISRHRIEVTSSFTGTSLLLFGAIDWGRLETDSNGDRDLSELSFRDHDVIIVVRGPAMPYVVRKKNEIAGIWVNSEQAVLDRIPSFYALASTRPPEDILLPEQLDLHPLGLARIPITWSSPPPAGAEADYRSAVLRDFVQAGLYSERPRSLQILGETLFRTEVYFPAHVPIGRYQAEVFLVRNGVIVSRQTALLTVDKIGFERAVHEFANDAPLAYGLVAVMIAVAAGLFAGAVSRRFSS